MKFCTHTIVLLIGFLLVDPLWAGLIEDQAMSRTAADREFSHGTYATALDDYIDLAEDGDKFAQYRLALMYYFGLGVEKDLVSAAVWAGVAQEPELIPLRQMYHLMMQEMSVAQKLELKQRLADLDLKYGATVMYKEKRLFPRATDCTGSRVGANCERVNSFGRLDDGQGNYERNPLVKHVWRTEDLNKFKTMYSELIAQEFAQFDAQASAHH